MADYNSRAFQQLLQQERQWNSTYFNALRPAGLSVFLLLQFLISGASPGSVVLIAHCAVAFVVWLVARKFSAVNRLSGLAVPFLDMPAIFLKQYLDLNMTDAPRAVANFSVALFVVLVMLSAFTLRTRQVVIATVVAVLLEFLLQVKAGDSLFGKIGSVATITMAGFLCEIALRRRIHLAQRISEERLRVEKLGRYFSPQVAATIQHSEDALAVGTTCEITVLFGDLRGFTAVTENSTPGEVLGLLNEFHTEMVEAVFAHEGTLDKYMGDGLMAYFGAPITQPDHATRALHCALAMQHAVQKLNELRTAAGKPALQLSIGLHTGPAVVGTIGAANRREFTAIGDTVNVAARIENLTRHFNCKLLVSGATATQIGEQFPLRSVAQTRLKGREEPVSVFVPASDQTQVRPEHTPGAAASL